MRALVVPDSPDEHMDLLVDALGPVARSPHWKATASLMVQDRGLLTYTWDRPGEVQNLSNWFGLLNDRSGTYPDAGPDAMLGDAVAGLYVAHEMAHLLMPTPQVCSKATFTDAFHRSERFASCETELRVYADVPELADLVPWRPLLATWLAGQGMDLTAIEQLMEWREAVIDDPSLLSELPGEARRLSGYQDNHGWAAAHWDRLDRVGWWRRGFDTPFISFSPATYRIGVAAQGTSWDRRDWVAAVVATVRRAFLLCGLPEPDIASVGSARDAAAELDGVGLACPDPT